MNLFCVLQVNAKAAGKAAIHCASVAGNIPMLKAILEFNPNLEVEVRNVVIVSYELIFS